MGSNPTEPTIFIGEAMLRITVQLPEILALCAGVLFLGSQWHGWVFLTAALVTAFVRGSMDVAKEPSNGDERQG